MKYKAYYLLLITLITFAPSELKGQIHQPYLQIPLITGAPVIDGKLDDAAWKKCTRLTEFVNWALNTYIKDSVTVYLCHDNKNIYVAFRNFDPEAEGLKRTVSPQGPRDTFLWGRNHVSVTIGNGDVSIRLMADPKGTMTDWKNNDITWNGNWVYSSEISKSEWTAEYSIPLSEAGINAISQDTELDMSLSRSFPLGESADWSGKCSLTGQNSLLVEYSQWPAPVPGDNYLRINIKNTSQNNLRLTYKLELIPLRDKPEFINQTGQGPSSDLQLKINSEPLDYNFSFSVPPGGSLSQKVRYELPHEGTYFASVTVLSMDGKLIRKSTDYWFTVEPNKRKIQELRKKVGESIATMTRISNPVSDTLRKEAENLLAAVMRLDAYSNSAWDSGKWDDLSAKVKKTDLDISRHLNKVRWTAFNNWNTIDDFGIALTHSIVKLKKDSVFPGPVSDKYDISLAGNEYESFQLAILPFGKSLKNFTVEVSDLENKKGESISKSYIDVSLVEYNLIDWQPDYVAEKGWYPDPLIPLKQGLSINGNDVCRPLWITVYAPFGTKAGDYFGTISVKAAGMKEITASIRCKVWDFDLPLVSHLKTHSWDQIDYFRDFYNLDEFPVDWYLKFCDLLLRNRFNPGSAGGNYLSTKPDSTGQYDFSKVEKVLGHCIDRGLTRFSMIQMKKGLYTPEEAEEVYKFVDAYAKFLKSRHWLDKALGELWDEPTDLEWPYIKERAERLKKIDPDIRLQLFAEGGPYDFWDKKTDRYGLNDLVNIWAPVNIIESPVSQAKGTEIWTYFCTLARESAPNFYIDCPAINQRSIAWYCWTYGVDGFEHWSTNYFWRNVRKGQPMDRKWPQVPWDSRTYYYFDGEGQLVYPGPDGTPYSSVRLENFREGMEDYEYLFRLKELLVKWGTNTTDPRMNDYRQLLYPEEYLLYKYPRKIKVTLENTLRHPDQPEIILETREKIARAIEYLQKGLFGK